VDLYPRACRSASASATSASASATPTSASVAAASSSTSATTTTAPTTTTTAPTTSTSAPTTSTSAPKARRRRCGAHHARNVSGHASPTTTAATAATASAAQGHLVGAMRLEPGPPSEGEVLELIAYRLQPPLLELARGDPDRAWMEAIPGRIAHRCLPLLIANQAGWMILNRGRVTATWSGGDHPRECLIESEGCPEPPLSHFGSGIITWRIPYLFRTPPGWNLLMRGPANLPKDGASSLEAVIETDWAVQPAFHSWKLTRAGLSVAWEDGEPICMILPQRRGEVESWQPRIDDVFQHQGLRLEYETFSRSRTEFNAARVGGSWQKHYFQGVSPGTSTAPAGAHQTKLRLHEFADGEP
jgi:uncharacterized protein DUF6065